MTNSGRHFAPRIRDDEQALTNDISIRTRSRMNANHGSLLQRPALTLGVLIISALVALFWISGILNPAPVAADDDTFYLDCPTTEVPEGGSVDVYLVRVTDHEHDDYDSFGAYWYTQVRSALGADFYGFHGNFYSSTEAEQLTGRSARAIVTRQDGLAEGNEYFEVSIDRPTGALAENQPSSCNIIIIDDDPRITEVEVTSSPGRDNTYGLGETIEISATFSAPVEVDGNPALGMWAGGWKAANYLRGSGSDTLVFGYTVQPDDRDNDGISMNGGYQDGNGTWHNFVNHTAVTGVGSDTVAFRTYAGLPVQPGHKIDGSLLPVGTSTEISSSPASGDTYRYGESIDIALTLSAPVDVEGAKNLNARVGGADATWRGPVYKSGSGTNTLVFGYTVQTRDLDTDGITVEGSYAGNGGRHGWGGSGTVKVKGTDVIVPPNFTGLSNQAGHQLDGRPYPKAISITSTPTLSPDTYGGGEVIQVTVNFGQNVTASDDAYAVLRIGTETNESRAEYVSGNGTDTLVFEYMVRSQDSDDNGVDAHVPAGQDIKATGTETAYQANPGGVIPTLGDNPDHKVEGTPTSPDNTAPTVSSISITSDPGDGDTYGLGDAVEVKVFFSEDVTVTGAPQLELDFGGTARTADYSNAIGVAVVFSYTVALDESDADGIAIGADKLTLNGGTIQDEAENDATLTHDAVAADSGHKVDGSDATAPTISSLSFTSDPGSDRTYGTGDTIQVTVTFSEDVTATGTPQLELNMSNSSTRQASYSSNSSGANVVFEYTVVVGDRASDGLEIRANKLTLNDGTIRDASGNEATLTHSNYFVPSNHFVNGIGGV